MSVSSSSDPHGIPQCGTSDPSSAYTNGYMENLIYQLKEEEKT